MYIKQKGLHSKCRACGNDQQLDHMHRAGTQLMKQLPKNMSEISASQMGETGQIMQQEGGADGAKKEKKPKEENLD